MRVNEEYSSPYYPHIVDVFPSVARKMWKKNKVLILDIRTPMEYEDHHIPGALLVPMDYLDVLLHKIPHKEIAVFCEHGNRARYATYGMPDLWKGRKVYYVIGGMAGWMGMGYEVESGIDENGVKWQKWLEELTNS
ncbi:rhodanese-like domain-containing protein [Stygiolobus sp. CP850M]|jgi:rhodanese-related sulfurtransferase|uniref:rhodanese-like domain-containing protein n=1 Tax=unclassified Stygiolobus TaxID=2824672 RepID=UPI0028CCA52F|nr:rhodanese-like domain-containing protein [Sulfolobaceae archaeon]